MLKVVAEAIGLDGGHTYGTDTTASSSSSSPHAVLISPVNLRKTSIRTTKTHSSMPGRDGPATRPAMDPPPQPSTSSRASSPSSSARVGRCATCSGPEEDGESNDARRGDPIRDNMYRYRSQLEQEVQKLQKQLQEEMELHVILANAMDLETVPSLHSSPKLPDKAQELLANIAALEITVSKLEEEWATLHFWLSYERNTFCLSQAHQWYQSSPSSEAPCLYSWEEHISSLRFSKLSGFQVPQSLQQDLSSSHGNSQPFSTNKLPGKCAKKEISGLCSVSMGVKTEPYVQLSKGMDFKESILMKKLWHQSNQLSEEMVRCMRNIFLCLSDSSIISSKVSSSELVTSPSSPVGHLSCSSLNSLSDSSMKPSLMQTSSRELPDNREGIDLENSFDPYGINGKVDWKNIGSYALADEVSWMSVGKTQLEYAAEALKKYRVLVEQLAEVNPSCMSNNEKLAFWINLYNSLIMHAYLAYGIPKSDIKLFSLMQKASYTVGGQSFSAAEIEFVILKMKPPAHRPQLALVLALHKFKMSEEHKKYSVDRPEPLALFALSSGLYSSPAVKVFSAENVQMELQNAMKDYIRASIGISDKGKLLVPKLLHSYARGVVEDSLLVDWICRYLTPDQSTIVRDSKSQQKRRLFGARSFILVPFDSRFRYLFLPDSESSTSKDLCEKILEVCS